MTVIVSNSSLGNRLAEYISRFHGPARVISGFDGNVMHLPESTEVVVNLLDVGSDGIFKDASVARMINVNLPAALSSACRKRGVMFIHLSSYQVFGGKGLVQYGSRAYSPQSEYAAMKAEADVEVAKADSANQLIIRPGFLYSEDTVKKLSKAATVMADAKISPTSEDALAFFIAEIITGSVMVVGDSPAVHFTDGVDCTIQTFMEKLNISGHQNGKGLVAPGDWSIVPGGYTMTMDNLLMPPAILQNKNYLAAANKPKRKEDAPESI
jgi:RmlD substrate binding domain